MENTLNLIMNMPAVALRGLTILPGMVIHFDLSRSKSITAVEQAMIGDQYLFVVTQKEMDTEEPVKEELYGVGTITKVKQISKLPNGIVRVLVQGESRGRLLSLSQEETQYLLAETESLPSLTGEIAANTEEAMVRELKELLREYIQYHPKIGKAMESRAQNINVLEELIDQITMNLPLAYTSKQDILEAEKLQERYDFLSVVLYNEIEIGKVKIELTERVKKRVDKNQKEYLLREQMAFIREELGEDSSFSDADQFEESVSKLKAGEEVRKKIRKEISRFKSLSSSSSESAVERAYIETLLEMPWDKVSKDNTDIVNAEKILEAQHYGLEKVKERILEFLAVRSLTKAGDSPIICLVGPPGTGKTSIAKSVAEALSKKYVRISLGGVRDEAEIRGHRKTYVGAMPGRIANGLRQAGVKNPLMLLDEIDKVSSDYKGDTSSALLEVLDSEQNNKFRDHYVEIPLDLSEVLFIATANTTETIPGPLLDRMELIEVNSYTENEKFHIARKHLLEKQYGKNGLDNGQINISDGALKGIISGYTKEAGVRGLERKIGEICRKAAMEILKKQQEEGKANKARGESKVRGRNAKGKQAVTPGEQRPDHTVKVTGQNLEKYLGKIKYMPDKRNETDDIGIVRGLAWTSVGGDTLQIEVNVMPGKGDVELTGQMGDVMKESALTGISFVRSISREYNISADTFKDNDFHIHIPEGAVPKDGPSAGITMATALISAITGIPVYANLAMTGEITLRGRVLPVGGLKEKILAAKMAGMEKVLVPSENRKDIEEIAREIKSGLKIEYVETMQEVLSHALVGPEKVSRITDK